MRYRTFGRLKWSVGEIGHGTWGLGGGDCGWKGGSDEEARRALRRSADLGCNFFDTAWIYGRGHSESLIGDLLCAWSGSRLYVATKIPPKNNKWPSRRGDRFEEIYPRDHILEYVGRSLRDLRTERIDLLQFHVWEDDWHDIDEWKEMVEWLKRQGQVEGVGISVNTWEPWNVLRTLQTGLIDAVQVIYNVFEQRPEEQLFPYCTEHDIALIARVPFDEGSLTNAINMDTRFEHSDWRAGYFVEENLKECVPRVERIRGELGNVMPMAEFALRFVLSNAAVSTVIPGMRRESHVQENFRAGAAGALPDDLLRLARRHRWDRAPTFWSQ